MLAYMRDLEAVVKLCTSRSISCSEDVQYLRRKWRNCMRVRTLACSAVKFDIRTFSFAIRPLQTRPQTSPKRPDAIHPVTRHPATEELRPPSVIFISITVRIQNLPIV